MKNERLKSIVDDSKMFPSDCLYQETTNLFKLKIRLKTKII